MKEGAINSSRLNEAKKETIEASKEKKEDSEALEEEKELLQDSSDYEVIWFKGESRSDNLFLFVGFLPFVLSSILDCHLGRK